MSPESRGTGFDAVGFDAVGFDAVGFDAVGFDAVGFDAVGFDAVGFDTPDACWLCNSSPGDAACSGETTTGGGACSFSVEDFGIKGGDVDATGAD
jgi:hypothetical protein